MPKNYLIEYSDSATLKSEINKIIKDNKFSDATIKKFDLLDDEMDKVLEGIDTYSFLSNETVVIVSSIHLLDINNSDTDHLIRYLDNPADDKLLIMVSDSLDNRKKITSTLKKKTKYIKLDDDPVSIIKNNLKDYKLEDGVIRLISSYTNNNVSAIINECNKLSLYCNSSKYISVNDVKSVCYEMPINTDKIIFDLVREISCRNKKESLKLYKTLSIYNIDDIMIVSLLTSQLQLLLQIISLSDRYLNDSDIAKLLDVKSSYRIQKSRELLRYVNSTDIVDLVKDLGEIDFKVKSGLIDSNRFLEMFIINI